MSSSSPADSPDPGKPEPEAPPVLPDADVPPADAPADSPPGSTNASLSPAPAAAAPSVFPSGFVPILAVLASLALVLAFPFLLRPPENDLFSGATRSIVVISPHSDTIRSEFALAFARHMKEKTGSPVRIDWRDVGGTSEITKFVDASYQAAFDLHWRSNGGGRWTDPASDGPGLAATSRLVPDDTPENDTQTEAARRMFLASDTGIGVDLLFGGGTPTFIQHAQQGQLVDSGIFAAEPDWFREDVIPQVASGEQLYDPEHRWVGNCLSSFGICYNVDWLARRGLDPPQQWTDLANPGYRETLAVADPTKSGSATKAYEMIIQQQLALAVDSIDPELVADMDQATRAALDKGWTAALNLIQEICANARYFTDNAAKIPFDVAQGNAAAGMSIDYFGRTLNEYLREADGSSRIQFVIPEGGSSIGADPIAMFRGAPHPELALEFIRFVLSPEGQRLWHYQAGVPSGPTRHALRRLPIRKDSYTEEDRRWSSDPDLNPYERAGSFHYHEEWTGPHFRLIQFVIQVMCLEPHEELQAAWDALCEADFPPQATRLFHDVGFVGYTAATDLGDQLRSASPLVVQKRRRDLREGFRRNYLQAAQLAKAGI